MGQPRREERGRTERTPGAAGGGAEGADGGQ